jgi:adenine-specific DNA methylase
MWSRLRALPPYLGGKRKLLGQIFKHLPPPAEAPVFIDGFLGGGSVSLMAKARGYRVISNDIALRSYIVGKALIENSRIKLEEVDITRLFIKAEDPGDFIKANFSPDVLPTEQAQFLDGAMAAVRKVEGVKRWLLLLLLTKFIIRQRPMGNFGARTIMRQIDGRDLERINPHYLRDILSRNVYGHPREILLGLMKDINRGIFDNGKGNIACRRDVFDFLRDVDGGDILYLDPPYAGTTSYESALKPLDSILEGKIIKSEPSVFSRKDALIWLERLFDSSQRFPVWTISYGNARISLDELKLLVRKFKSEIISEEYKYAHLKSLSRQERSEENMEFLIIAR